MNQKQIVEKDGVIEITDGCNFYSYNQNQLKIFMILLTKDVVGLIRYKQKYGSQKIILSKYILSKCNNHTMLNDLINNRYKKDYYYGVVLTHKEHQLRIHLAKCNGYYNISFHSDDISLNFTRNFFSLYECFVLFCIVDSMIEKESSINNLKNEQNLVKLREMIQ